MNIGKTASQAGHAYLGAFLKATEDRKKEYHWSGIGTKVCLVCQDLGDLIRYHHLAKELGLSTVFIEDSGNNTCFNGVTTATAVGIGPCTKAEVAFLKKLQLHK
jgi:peptidyl-tRNA hydrolase